MFFGQEEENETNKGKKLFLTSVNSVNYIKTKAQYVTRERETETERESMGTVW